MITVANIGLLVLWLVPPTVDYYRRKVMLSKADKEYDNFMRSNIMAGSYDALVGARYIAAFRRDNAVSYWLAHPYCRIKVEVQMWLAEQLGRAERWVRNWD